MHTKLVLKWTLVLASRTNSRRGGISFDDLFHLSHNFYYHLQYFICSCVDPDATAMLKSSLGNSGKVLWLLLLPDSLRAGSLVTTMHSQNATACPEHQQQIVKSSKKGLKWWCNSHILRASSLKLCRYQSPWYLECWFIFDDMLINTKSNLPFMGSLRGPSKRPPGRSSPMRHHFYQDRHHHHIYIMIISSTDSVPWWHTMTYNTLFIIWYHSRYQNIDHPPRLKCGSQNACFCQGWSITYPRAVNQLCACSLFQKQVCIDWSKSDPSDSISILWKTNSEVCLVFISSVVSHKVQV